MAYFAALLARSDDGWDAADVELDDVGDIDGLGDVLRTSAYEDQPVLLFLEQEDMWFAVVRVDGEDDPRVFVSDTGPAARSAYGDVLLARLVGDVDELIGLPDADGFDEDASRPEPVSGPVGDPGLLADLGVPSGVLLEMCAGDGMLPTDALAEIAERAGFADALESMR